MLALHCVTLDEVGPAVAEILKQRTGGQNCDETVTRSPSRYSAIQGHRASRAKLTGMIEAERLEAYDNSERLVMLPPWWLEKRSPFFRRLEVVPRPVRRDSRLRFWVSFRALSELCASSSAN
jgi:hypothetical protein